MISLIIFILHFSVGIRFLRLITTSMFGVSFFFHSTTIPLLIKENKYESKYRDYLRNDFDFLSVRLLVFLSYATQL